MHVVKEPGKLTPDQFSDFVKRLPEVRGKMQELPHFLRQNERRVNELLGTGAVFWGNFYERPLLEQMALLFVQIGLHIPPHQVVQTEDP